METITELSSGHPVDRLLSLLADAGIEAQTVERCPSPRCEQCSHGPVVLAA